VELSTALAPLILHVAYHPKRLPHILIKELVVIIDYSFQILHYLPHHLHSLETLLDRCVEI
jgi:hypothetical protein